MYAVKINLLMWLIICSQLAVISTKELGSNESAPDNSGAWLKVILELQRVFKDFIKQTKKSVWQSTVSGVFKNLMSVNPMWNAIQFMRLENTPMKRNEMRAETKAERQEFKHIDSEFTTRYRRHRYNMAITMVFGIVALSAVLVPLGFQVLSVVSGKALLLAKMALLLASINGLKRVANSGVHYGLYHVPGEPYGGTYYDRGDLYNSKHGMV